MPAKKYSKSYENIRRFLRQISYGCYHRDCFPRLGTKVRSYDEALRRLRFFMPSAHLQETRQQRYTYVTFCGDAYHGCDNYLVHSFQTKSLLPAYCLYTLSILQLLYASDTPLTMDEIIVQVNDALTIYDTVDQIKQRNNKTDITEGYNDNSIRRRTKELIQDGWLAEQTSGRIIRYKKVVNPLKNLPVDDALELYYAVNFYKNTSLLNTPGHYLSDTLQKLYAFELPVLTCYQFKSNNFVRILDEETISTILQCMKTQHTLSYTHGAMSKKDALKQRIPLQLETEYTYNRHYLIVAHEKKLQRLRIDHMENVSIDSSMTIPAKKIPHTEKDHSIHIRFTFALPTDRTHILRKIQNRYPSATITYLSETSMECNFSVMDPRKLLPWLRTFHPYAEILPSPTHHLRERMISDIREALKNYDETI